MFNDLNELYQELILDHNASPHNFGEIKEFTNMACGHNPLCGDKITIFIQLKLNKILNIKFKGNGCAISKASASMMTDALIGKTIVEANKLFDNFHFLLTSDKENIKNLDLLGKLLIFKGVKKFPIRIKCATLSWHTMKAALDKNNKNISTE